MNVEQQGIKVRKIIGYVGEHPNIYNDVTVKNIHKFVKKSHKDWDDEAFNSLLNKFNIYLILFTNICFRYSFIYFSNSGGSSPFQKSSYRVYFQAKYLVLK